MKTVYAKWSEVIEQFAQGSKDARMGARQSGGWGGFMSGGGGYLPKGNCFIEGDSLYSYRESYLLAQRLDPAQNAGVKFLINGDSYSITTNAQRNYCIHKLETNVQIPFSALWSAGVSPRAISILDSQPDRYVQREQAGEKLWYDNEFPGRYRSIESICSDTEKHSRARQDSELADRFDPVQDHYLGAVLFRAHDRLYLSGFDDNEPIHRRHYFLTRLQEGSRVSTVAEALEDLKPAEVKEAESAGVEVRRQGDLFFIASDLNARQQTPRSGQILGSSHWVSKANHRGFVEQEFVRGSITHKPSHSGPRHARIKLGTGKEWYRVVKNTADGGWEAQGNVD